MNVTVFRDVSCVTELRMKGLFIEVAAAISVTKYVVILDAVKPVSHSSHLDSDLCENICES